MLAVDRDAEGNAETAQLARPSPGRVELRACDVTDESAPDDVMKACDDAFQRIDILIHPQSVIHSMVSYVDGSVLAQMGDPDMRTPIAYTLAWPERMAAPVERLDLAKVGQLTFEAPDPERFPALSLARQVLEEGGGAPTILNAANEVAVHAFLERRIGFLDIAAVVPETLAALPGRALDSLETVRAVDGEARARAEEALDRAAGA